MFKRIANISVEIAIEKRAYKNEVTIIINSYSTQILKMHFVDYGSCSGFERSYCFNAEKISKTTANHQRLAKAFLMKTADYEINRLHESALKVFGTAKTLTEAWYNLNTKI